MRFWISTLLLACAGFASPSDTEGKPDIAFTKAKQLVGVDKVDLLTGISLTPECHVLVPDVRELVRFTQTSAQHAEPIVAYAIKNGLRQAGDFFGATFVGPGGQIVQELHPSFGTTRVPDREHLLLAAGHFPDGPWAGLLGGGDGQVLGKRMRPRLARLKPMLEPTVVDLPAPFRPSRQTSSLSPTTSDTPCKTWLAP